MSNEPLGKRQKRGGGDDRPMYDEATARKMLKEVVLVSAVNAEDGEEVIGFDPDDEALDNLYYINDDSDYWSGDEITPLHYFVQKGDAKMCRYLISQGASTTKSSEEGYQHATTFPMYIAADRGYLDICKVLYANGAQNDVWRGDGDGWTPFHSVTVFHGDDETGMVRWLVLQGALCADDNSEEIDRDLINAPDLFRFQRCNVSRSCEQLVEWAKEKTESHSALVMFLFGTLPPAPDNDQSCTLLQYLSGQPGVRKHIAEFVGMEITKVKHLRILRSAVDVLPSFIKPYPKELFS